MSEKLEFVEITTDAKTPFGNFYDGEIRKVSPEVSGFLMGNAWARPHRIELSVDSVTVGIKSEDF